MHPNELQTKSLVRVGVVGAAGYAGAELLHWLTKHPHIEIAALFGSRSEGESITNLVPAMRGILDLHVQPADHESIAATELNAVFLCTPHEASASLAPALLASNMVVLDLSAAFRFRDAKAYPEHYGFIHPDPASLADAVYALPELHHDAIANSNLLACPGCYPTSCLIPLTPLLQQGLLDPATPCIIDSTSGVSGAGKTPTAKTAFCEVSQRAYGIFTHRHAPEIAQGLSGLKVIFTPHLGPYPRGIATTIHTQLAAGCGVDDVTAAWQATYGDKPFVRLRSHTDWPGVGDVTQSNFIDLAAAADNSGHLIIGSAIDNLTKGAAGQAVQAFNIRFGFPQTTSLLPAANNAGVHV